MPRIAARALALSLVIAAVGRPALAAEQKKLRVVVLSIKALDDESRRPAQVLTEILLTSLSKAGRLEILGDSEIAAMLGFEKQKELLGCTEGSCLAQIGGALGCEYLVLGTLGRVGSKLRLDLKLADLRKSAVLAREGSAVISVDDLEGAIGRAINVLLAALPARTRNAAAEPAAPPQSHPSVSAPASSGRGPLPWILIGTGGAAIVAGGVLTGVTLATKSRLSFNDARTRSTAGVVVASVGVAALAAGIVVYAVTGGDKPEPKVAVGVAPSASGATFAVSGHF